VHVTCTKLATPNSRFVTRMSHTLASCVQYHTPSSVTCFLPLSSAPPRPGATRSLTELVLVVSAMSQSPSRCSSFSTLVARTIRRRRNAALAPITTTGLYPSVNAHRRKRNSDPLASKPVLRNQVYARKKGGARQSCVPPTRIIARRYLHTLTGGLLPHQAHRRRNVGAGHQVACARRDA
jgi:hypothetical protein